jgi:hypothetical protein
MPIARHARTASLDRFPNAPILPVWWIKEWMEIEELSVLWRIGVSSSFSLLVKSFGSLSKSFSKKVGTLSGKDSEYVFFVQLYYSVFKSHF